MPTEATVLFCAIGWLFLGSIPATGRAWDHVLDFIAGCYDRAWEFVESSRYL